jgi:F0F1-type ATP synthase membrane subunit b/b'
MPESIQKPNFSTVVRDVKVNLEREAKRNAETDRAKQNSDDATRNTRRREEIRTTELQNKNDLQKKVVEKSTEDVQQARRTEDKSNPRSGDIINVVA